MNRPNRADYLTDAAYDIAWEAFEMYIVGEVIARVSSYTVSSNEDTSDYFDLDWD